MPINCKLAPAHQQEVPSIHPRSPRNWGIDRLRPRLTLSQPDPLCAAGVGRIHSGPPLFPPPGLPLPKSGGTGTLTWVAPVPPAGRAVPRSLLLVFPTDIPLSVSPAVSMSPAVSLSSPGSVSPVVSVSPALSLSPPAPAAWHSLPGHGAEGERRGQSHGQSRGLGWRAQGRHRPLGPPEAREGVTGELRVTATEQ